MHGNTFLRTPVACSLVIVSGMRRPSVQHTAVGDRTAERIETKAFVHQLALRMQTEDNGRCMA